MATCINLCGSFLENWVSFLQVCYLVSNDHIDVGSYLKQNVKVIRIPWIQDSRFGLMESFTCVTISFIFKLIILTTPNASIIKKGG